MAHHTVTQNGMIVAPGDAIIDFRGHAHIYVGIARHAEPGKDGKLTVKDGRYTHGIREFYFKVFPGLTVTRTEENEWIAVHSNGFRCIRATTTHDCESNHNYMTREQFAIEADARRERDGYGYGRD